MDKVWLKRYPQGIPAEVDVRAYSSLKQVFETSCQRFADLPAYSNMGVSITYRQLDQASRDFGAYLRSRSVSRKATGSRSCCRTCCSTRSRCLARCGLA